MLQALADALDQQAHRLALDVGEALHAQNVVRRRGGADALQHLGGRVDRRNVDDEALEVVVVVPFLVVVMGGPRGEVAFSGRLEAEQDVGVDARAFGLDDFDGARHRRPDLVRHARALGRAQQVGLVEHDEVGAQKLVLVDLLQRIVVIERGIVRLLFRQRFGIVGKAAGSDGGAIDDGNDAVDGDARGDGRPVERLHQRFRQRQARRLDDDVLGRIGEAEQALERGDEVVGDGAADAAVGEFDDAILGAGLDAAALEDFAVDADVAELVDDDGQAAPLGILQDVAHERRLAGAEKPRDDAARNLGDVGHGVSGSGCTNPRGGTRAMTPLRNGCGRSDQGTMPLGER